LRISREALLGTSQIHRSTMGAGGSEGDEKDPERVERELLAVLGLSEELIRLKLVGPGGYCSPRHMVPVD